MPTSLLKLCKEGAQLHAAQDFEIHYPAEGAENLSSAEDHHFWFTERRLFVLSLIRKFAGGGKLFVDVGCGSGATALWLTQQGFPTLGIDAHPGFKRIQEKNLTPGFLQGDIFSVEPEMEFDGVLLMDTIEHIKEDLPFVNHVTKMLKHGGIVIITVPAFQSLWSTVDDQAGHFRRYVKKDMSRFERLRDNRLELVFSSYYYGAVLPMYFISRMLKKRKSDQTYQMERTPAGLIGALVNWTLKMVLKLEMQVAMYFGMPFGSSLFVVFKKI